MASTSLASHQLGRGHVCLDINATLNAPDFALSLPPEGDDLTDPPPLPSDVLATLTLTLSEWQAALHHPLLTSEGPGNTPLVVVTTHSANGSFEHRSNGTTDTDTRCRTASSGTRAAPRQWAPRPSVYLLRVPR